MIQIDLYTTLYDVLHTTPTSLTRKSKNKRFKEIIETFIFDENEMLLSNEFKIYGPLLKILFDRGVKRVERTAGRSMCELIAYEIPELCCEEIFFNLRDRHLDKLKNSLKYLEER